jgi:hypothetical protein
MIPKKSLSVVLALSTLLMVLAVPSGGVLQAAVAQSLEDDDAEDELEEQEADNEADEDDGANLSLQEQDGEQEQELEEFAGDFDFDFQQDQEPGRADAFCLSAVQRIAVDGIIFVEINECFETQEACEAFEAGLEAPHILVTTEGCRPVP